MLYCVSVMLCSLLSSTPALCCRLWCPTLFSVWFFTCWPFCLLKRCLPTLGPRPLLFLGAPCSYRDRNSTSRHGSSGETLQHPSGRREYGGVCRALLGSRSATDKTCLMVFLWGGLAESFKSRMSY